MLTQNDITPETGAALNRRLGQRTGDLHRTLARPGGDPAFQPVPVTSADLAAWVAEAQDDLSDRIARVADLPPSGQCTRIHGDYHLGQVLVTADDVAIIDFEGEPRRSLAARRAKTAPPARCAGMIRSLDYAARSAAQQADDWRRQAVRPYLSAYEFAMTDVAAHPDPELRAALLDLFLLQKAAYEIRYELANRPGRAHLPLAGLVALTEREEPHD